MFGSKHQINRSYKNLAKNNFIGKEAMTDADYEDLVEYARSIGAKDIGVTKLDRSRIFSNHAIMYDIAIVFTMEMDEKKINMAPSRETGHEVHRTYYELSVIVNKAANHLRNRGYNVQANSPLGGDVNFVGLARDANLGEVGNHGLLISKEVGPRQRIATIFTNAEINYKKYQSKEDYAWINEFCIKCQKCVIACPAKAINPEAAKQHLTTRIDYKKCAVPFANDSGCSVCIKECVFNYTDYVKIKKSFIK